MKTYSVTGSAQGPIREFRGPGCAWVPVAHHAATSLQAPGGRDAQGADRSTSFHFQQAFVLASGPEGIDEHSLRKLTNVSLGRMESKETVFLPFPGS